VYEHIRANLAKDIAAAEERVTQAIARRDQAVAALAERRADLARAQQAVADAVAALTARQQELAAAQAVVDQRTAVRDAAQANLDDAQRAFDQNGGDEPPFFDNPEDLRRWHELHDALKAAIEDARDALNATLPPLAQAVQARDGAQSAVNAAAGLVAADEGDVRRATLDVTLAEQSVTNAEGGITQARIDVDAVKAKVTALDQREAVLKAAPLDRPSLERAADQEEADLQAGWQRRRQLFENRVSFRDGRRASLAAHDTTMDELAVLRSRIAGSPEAGRFPGLGPVLTELAAVLADNAAQRTRPPLERTDDIEALRGRLTSLMFALQDVTGAATVARDAAIQDLEAVRAALIDHQQENH
jgi:chromosome segregation ATPase